MSYDSGVLLQSTASARQAVQRLQNIGSGADGSTSFFVLAPCVPCLLSEIIDDERYLNQNNNDVEEPHHHHKDVNNVKEMSQKKKKTSSSSTIALRQKLSQPTWLGVLTALGYECLDEENQQKDDAQVEEDEDPFSSFEFIEECRRNWIIVTSSENNQEERHEESKSAEDFWKERLENEEEEDEDEEAAEEENDEHLVAKYFAQQSQQQQHQQQTPDRKHKPAAPSEFEKHLEEWKKRHLITVPDSAATGTDALQLRGGKSSVITWAQREMDKYRKLAALSRNRIRVIKKQADKILEQTDENTAARFGEDGGGSIAKKNKRNNEQHEMTASTVHYAGMKEVDDDHGDVDANESVDSNSNHNSNNNKKDSRVQMLRRVVASKSVLAMQAQSSAPATATEAALWTHSTPPTGVSAILSVIADDNDENVDAQIQKHQQRINNNNNIAEKKEQNQRKMMNNNNRNNSNPDQQQLHQSITSLPPNYKSKSQIEEESLEQMIHDRMELLMGGYSPGVFVAETNQPDIQATSANDKREERRRAVAEYNERHGRNNKSPSPNSTTTAATGKNKNNTNTTTSTSGFRKNTSAINPHEVKTSMVLVQKTPGERKKILQEYYNGGNSSQRDDEDDGDEHHNDDNSEGVDDVFDTPAVSMIDRHHHHQNHENEHDDHHPFSTNEEYYHQNNKKNEQQQQNNPTKRRSTTTTAISKEPYSKTRPLVEIARERKRLKDKREKEEFEREQQKINFQPSLARGDALLGKIHRRMKAPPSPEHHFFENEWDTTTTVVAASKQKQNNYNITRPNSAVPHKGASNQKQQNRPNSTVPSSSSPGKALSTSGLQKQQKQQTGPHPDDLYHWVAMQQLAVLAMQQPPKEKEDVNIRGTGKKKNVSSSSVPRNAIAAGKRY